MKRAQRNDFIVYKTGDGTLTRGIKEATEFVNKIGVERVISITESKDENSTTIAVWYWEEVFLGRI